MAVAFLLFLSIVHHIYRALVLAILFMLTFSRNGRFYRGKVEKAFAEDLKLACAGIKEVARGSEDLKKFQNKNRAFCVTS